ncbi:MAG: hypothetical protein HKN01_01435 [Acidimicrobiia bacterium]|nr:hypothetical protein [Acidimicrobiia bacterium]
MTRGLVASRLGIPWTVYRRIEIDDTEVPVELDIEAALDWDGTKATMPSPEAVRNTIAELVHRRV